MDLTPQQKATLKTTILAEPAVAAYLAVGDDGSIAAYYNAASGDIGWRSDMSADVVVDALIAGASEVDNLSQGKRDTLFFIARADRTLDAREAKVRSSFVDLTAGSPANATIVRAALSDGAKRSLSRAERLFATGPTAGAYIPVVEGELSPGDVGRVLRG